MRCEQLAEDLAGVADGTVVLDPRARVHVEHCLRCQAGLVHHRRILKAMRDLRGDFLQPSPDLLSQLLAGIERSGDRHSMRSALSPKRVFYLGGIAAATAAAGAAGALVLASRHRRVS